MGIESLPQIVRDGKRLHQIVGTIAKYGLAPWMTKLDVHWIQKIFRTADGEQISQLSEGVRVRMALTELGTTFVKLGQILSTRPDLVGPEITNELSKLQSSTPSDPPEYVRSVIEAELGRSPDELFRSFSDSALASASIGQVHLATLDDGTGVVVKVQHKGIEGKIKSDLEITKHLAELAHQHWPAAHLYRLPEIIDEFSRTLLHELDFNREKRNMERFALNFSDNPLVKIPTAYEHFSTSRVLTMERLDGVEVGNTDAIAKSGIDTKQVAKLGAEVVLEMIFRDGFYHADPHPGNIFVLPNGCIGLLDFGMVGRIDDQLREQFEDLLMAAAQRDSVSLCDAICKLGSLPGDLDVGNLRADISDFLSEYASQTLVDLQIGPMLNRMMEIIRKYGIVLPSRVSMLIKVLIMLEGTAKKLNPNFSMAEVIEPYQAKIVQRRYAPSRMFRKAKRNAEDWTRLAEMAPAELAEILTQLKRGQFDIHLEHRKLDNVINRLVMGILTAAVFIGSSLMISLKVIPLLFDVSVVGTIGLLSAIVMACRLVKAVSKSEDVAR